MRYVVFGLSLTLIPAVIGTALYLNDRPYIAAIFFLAAAIGGMADVIKIVRGMRGRG